MDENNVQPEIGGGTAKASNSTVKYIIIAGVAVVVVAALVLLGIFVIKPAAALGKASSLENKGEYAQAYESYNRLDSAKAAERKAALQQKVITSRGAQQAITLGGIEWQVLEVRDNKALVITKNIVKEQPYNTASGATTWADCSLRTYLNSSFLDSFSDAEKARVLLSKIKNVGNPEYGTANGKDTQDQVFLLSLEEANLYFLDNGAREAKLNNFNGYWWLRSAGMQDGLAATVTSDGSIAYAGSGVNYTGRGVRPAMWITLA